MGRTLDLTSSMPPDDRMDICTAVWATEPDSFPFLRRQSTPTILHGVNTSLFPGTHRKKPNSHILVFRIGLNDGVEEDVVFPFLDGSSERVLWRRDDSRFWFIISMLNFRKPSKLARYLRRPPNFFRSVSVKSESGYTICRQCEVTRIQTHQN